ncbi:hypothetical protein HY546_02725 [archaeon]|nr:hypothetical protein [archaeon]
MVVFHVNKQLAKGKYKLFEVVGGLETSKVLKKLLGRPLGRFLSETVVEINRKKWIMFIDEKRKLISVNHAYLQKEEERTLYLDFFHELVHIKQLGEGKKLFHESLPYVDWPTEIEAYKLTVQEAREIGMGKKDIAEYLLVPWITKKEHALLVSRVM